MNRFGRYFEKLIHIIFHRYMLQSSFLVRLIATTIIINFLIYAMIGLWLYKDRQDYHRIAEITTQNMAKVIESNICGIFNRIDTGLFSLMYETERQLSGNKVNKAALDRYIGRLLDNLPELFDISVADAKGNVLYGTDIVTGKSVNIKDREYFRFLRENPVDEMIISELVHGRVSGRWMFVLARRINYSDGSFAGTAIGMFDVSFFGKLFSKLDTGRNGVISVVDREFRTVALKANERGKKSLIGSDVISQKTRDLITENTVASTYKLISAFDKIERVVSLHKAGKYPFYIITASAIDDIMWTWKNEAVIALILAVIFTLTTIFSSRFIFKSREAQLLHMESKRYAEEMRQQNEELNEALARVKRLEGIIPICSYCKKIRNEEQSWEALEKYFMEHSDALFSHGVCPECAKKFTGQ